MAAARQAEMRRHGLAYIRETLPQADRDAGKARTGPDDRHALACMVRAAP